MIGGKTELVWEYKFRFSFGPVPSEVVHLVVHQILVVQRAASAVGCLVVREVVRSVVGLRAVPHGSAAPHAPCAVDEFVQTVAGAFCRH